jgi:hypothetical protein
MVRGYEEGRERRAALPPIFVPCAAGAALPRQRW